MSLPTRERGLKCNLVWNVMRKTLVAPYAGAWIEMFQYSICWSYCLVAPYAGAWIEIQKEQELTTQQLRRSLRGSVD